MGELVAARPALRLDFPVSLPLDLGSVASLLYRAVPGSGLDPWLIATRRALPPALRADLDLLHGFSGRLLYYLEEPIMRFEPLGDDRRDATFAELLAFLEAEPAESYRSMAIHALRRVHHDDGRDIDAPRPTPDGADDESAWRRFLAPGLTTADADQVLPLLLDPAHLRARTLGLFRGLWETVYRDEWERRLPELTAAADVASGAADRGFAMAFADLTGSRLPSTLVPGLNEVARVAFCPSAHLGSFVSYILYPPDLVVFFGAPALLARSGRAVATRSPNGTPAPAETGASNGAAASPTSPDGDPGDGRVPVQLMPAARALPDADLLEGLRAMADPNRLRILDLLGAGELYAQEIVGRLGIAQSAVSRHLSQLERAGLVSVRPRGGMKYYAIDAARVDAVAAAVRARAATLGAA